MMRSEQFDPFGEPAASQLKAVRGGSPVVQKLGVGVFWALVVAIVATRVAYFDAGLEDTLRFVANVARSMFV